MNFTTYQELCKWCRQQRIAQKISAYEMARLTKMGRQTILRFEKGEQAISLPNLILYLEVLRLKIDITNV
jgi:transcriptional regulator with XRE-family HTH domain